MTAGVPNKANKQNTLTRGREWTKEKGEATCLALILQPELNSTVRCRKARKAKKRKEMSQSKEPLSPTTLRAAQQRNAECTAQSAQVRDWIERVLKKPLLESRETTPDALSLAIRDGVALCHVVNEISPGKIRAIATTAAPLAADAPVGFRQRENVLKFVAAASEIIAAASPPAQLSSSAGARTRSFDVEDLCDRLNFSRVLDMIGRLAAAAEFRGFKVPWANPDAPPPPSRRTPPRPSSRPGSSSGRSVSSRTSSRTSAGVSSPAAMPATLDEAPGPVSFVATSGKLHSAGSPAVAAVSSGGPSPSPSPLTSSPVTAAVRPETRAGSSAGTASLAVKQEPTAQGSTATAVAAAAAGTPLTRSRSRSSSSPISPEDHPAAVAALHLAISSRGTTALALRILETCGVSADDQDASGTLPIHTAVSCSVPDAVLVLAAAGADVNARDQSGSTPLHRACERKDAEVVDALLSTGRASLNLCNAEGSTAIHLAVSSGAEPIVIRLIDAGADLTARDGHGNTPLHLSVRADSLGIAERIVSNCRAACSVQNADGEVPFDLARSSAMLYLLKSSSGGKVHPEPAPVPEEKVSSTPRESLYAACFKGDPAAVDEICQRGTTTNFVPESGFAPIHVAAFSGNVAVIDVLARHGAAVDMRSKDGSTALILAIEGEKLSAAERLIRLGADPNATSNDGTAPLHVAVCKHSVAIVQLLLANGARVNESCPALKNNTPLHLCLSNFSRSRDIFFLLLGAGASVTATNRNGLTPLAMAIVWGHEDACSALVHSNSSLDARTKHGRRPLDLALYYGRQNIAAMLAGRMGVRLSPATTLGQAKSPKLRQFPPRQVPEPPSA